MNRAPLIVETDRGLYCPRGDFHIDAWRPVPRNVVTHAHADHARRGSARYLSAARGAGLLRRRLGDDITLDALDYGRPVDHCGVRVSLHPAGHVLGSAQVRLEAGGEVWVVSGDYKRQPDPTCEPFEPVRCHTFVTECTFGLPVFRWDDADGVMRSVNAWWRENVAAGQTSILLAYSLGKAERVLAGLDASVGPILLHGAVDGIVREYRAAGVPLPPAQRATPENAGLHRGRGIVIAPPSAMQGSWSRKFAPFSVGVASGWMRLRGFRRRRGADRGFVLSDHVDFPDLLGTIAETGAGHVIATHGYTDALVRLMRERGKEASAFRTRFGDDEETAGSPPPPLPPPSPPATDIDADLAPQFAGHERPTAATGEAP